MRRATGIINNNPPTPFAFKDHSAVKVELNTHDRPLGVVLLPLFKRWLFWSPRLCSSPPWLLYPPRSQTRWLQTHSKCTVPLCSSPRVLFWPCVSLLPSPLFLLHSPRSLYCSSLSLSLSLGLSLLLPLSALRGGASWGVTCPQLATEQMSLSCIKFSSYVSKRCIMRWNL